MSLVKTRSVSELIIDSFKLIGMYNEDNLPPSFRIQEGINALNDLVSVFQRNSILIPYDKILRFPAVIGQGEYYISEEIGADVVHSKPYYIAYSFLEYAGTHYPMKFVSDNVWQESLIVETSTGRPFYWGCREDEKGTILKLFPKPSILYTIAVKGKFKMKEWAVGDTFIDEEPGYYLFLKYAVARELSSYYETSTWNEFKENKYNELVSLFMAINDRDYSMKLGPTSRYYIGYRLVNT